MNIIFLLLVIGSLIWVPIFLTLGLINIIRKRSSKKSFKLAGISALAFVIGLIGFGLTSENDTSPTTTHSSSVSPEVSSSTPVIAEDTSTEPSATIEPKDNIPTEYRSALNRADTYSKMMHMSKAAIYDQLTSEYGDKFSPEAAQYAVDNIDANWNENALASAKNYSDTLYMSKQGIYDQLISEYGDKFSPEEAQYAIDNVQADWNANALEKAKNYQNNMNMSPAAIHDQLISEYGEKFTQAEADYAIEHLE